MSDIKLYDDALVLKIKSVFQNTIYGFNELAFKIKSQESAVTLPLISIFRLPYSTKPTFYNAYMKARGNRASYSTEKTEVSYLKSIELLDCKYQIDVWSEDFETNNRVTQELIWFLKDDSDLEIIESNTKQKLVFYLELSSEILNNTDLNTFVESGRLYRQSFELELRNPRLFNIHKLKTVKEIDVRVEVIATSDVN